MNDATPPGSGELAFAADSTGTPQSATTILSRKTKLLLLIGGVALLAFDVGFILWWRQWAWGNQLFNGPHGMVAIQKPGRLVYGSRREALRETQIRFTYEGKAIHPAIFFIQLVGK